MKLYKKLTFKYTPNQKNPEYPYYQCLKNSDFKIYDYLLEMDFGNEEYREFYDHFKQEYHISTRIFNFILGELKKYEKVFGKDVLVDMCDCPKYDKEINTIKRNNLPRDLPKNIQRNYQKWHVKLMIDRQVYFQYLPLDIELEKVIKIRDDMKKFGRCLTKVEIDEILVEVVSIEYKNRQSHHKISPPPWFLKTRIVNTLTILEGKNNGNIFIYF